MKRCGKIIRMNPGYIVGGFGMFLIYRKNNLYQDSDNETGINKKASLIRTDLMRAIRN